jgi:hypothetical protein
MRRLRLKRPSFVHAEQGGGSNGGCDSERQIRLVMVQVVLQGSIDTVLYFCGRIHRRTGRPHGGAGMLGHGE